MSKDFLTFTVDNREVSAEEGTSLLEVIRKLEIPLPTLCHLSGLDNPVGCGLCTVEREPAELVQACRTVVEAGAVYHTDSPAAVGHRRQVLKLLLARHEPRCHVCDRHGDCELERLFAQLRITDGRLPGIRSLALHDRSSPCVVLHGDRCVMCGRCAVVCRELQGVDALRTDGRLLQTRPRGRLGLDGPPCIGCGQCTLVCPTGALQPAAAVPAVEAALLDRDRYCAAVLTPTAAAALMSELGVDALPRLLGVLVQLGFDAVLNASWGADLYYAKLADFLAREPRPISIVSRCPAVRRYIDQRRPGARDWLLPFDSPARDTAVQWRDRLAHDTGVQPSRCYLVQISVCTAAKEEVRRNAAAGNRGLDALLTVRECAALFRRLRVGLDSAKPRSFGRWRGSRDGMLHGAPGVVIGALESLWAARSGTERSEREDFYLTDELALKLETPAGPRAARVHHGMPRCIEIIDELLERGQSEEEPLLLELYACRGGCLGGGGLLRLPTPAELQRRYQALVYLADGAAARHPQQNQTLTRLFPEYFNRIESDEDPADEA